MLTEMESKVLTWLQAETANGGWYAARHIADYSGVFNHLTNRSKAGAMTALLKKLHAGGYVEMD